MDKGTFSNIASTGLFALGLVLPEGPVQAFVLSTGMFAFSGGITNSLAVKMLFDRIPGLVGSGVIPARFREVRMKVKDLIMTHFFEPSYLREYLRQNGEGFRPESYLLRSEGSRGAVTGFIEQQWDRLAAPEIVQPIVDRQIERLMDSSIGGLLTMLGPESVKPAVSQFVSGLVASLKERVLELSSSAGVELELDEERIVSDLRSNVAKLLEAKLQQLDATRVKRMMEEVIRHHLGWLVVWGNVFGGLLGVLAYLLER